MKHLVAFLAAAAVGVGAMSADGPAKVAIGIVPSLVADLSDGQQKFVEEEFPVLIKDFTGLGGSIDRPGSRKELADKVAAGAYQFGVFQGIEFAESQASHSELKPLLLSVYRSPVVKALAITKKDSPAASFADLKGKDVAILKEGKEHIRRYVRKESGGDPEKFFGKVVTPANAEAALDAILLDKVQAAIVDAASIDIYREVNPGKYRRLHAIGESTVFPPSVIAYNPNKVDPAVVKQFADGMLRADQNEKGREVMATFKITSFAVVPPEFDKTLAEIRKAYGE